MKRTFCALLTAAGLCLTLAVLPAPASAFTDVSGDTAEAVEVLYSLLSTGGVDAAMDIFQPKNLYVYLKTLNKNADLRKALSSEFMALVEAARKTRQSFMEQKSLPEPEDKEA